MRRQNLDPADIPKFSIKILNKERKIPKLKGKAHFYHGRLTGLSKAIRLTEVGIECLRPAVYSMSFFLGFGNLKLAYDGKIKYGSNPMIPFQVHADIPFLLVYVEVINYPRTEDPAMLPGKPAIKKIVLHQLDAIGKLKTMFYSTSPLKSLTKILENGLISHTKTAIFSFLANKLNDVLRRAIATYPNIWPTQGICSQTVP